MNENCIAALSVLFYADGPMTTTEVAKRVFDIGDDGERLKNAERKVRYYLTDSYPWLVERHENGDGGDRYTVNEDAVWFGLGNVNVVPADFGGDDGTDGGEELFVGLGFVLVYMNEDDEPQVVNVDMGEGVQNPVSDSLL